MANKKSKKEPFQWERFIAAKKRAKISMTASGGQKKQSDEQRRMEK